MPATAATLILVVVLLAGLIAAAVVFDQVSRSGVPGMLTSWARRRRPLARPQPPEAGLQP
ncbi:hypothetical protein CVM73_07430 [Bradyrhizobium forestalis]|uniref:Uncharacterized protein n=1 Tax=Bradyrhizobium forestalis TaxID=1419263 RepID=A0A2M8RDR9_9BRAD|nr:hypothetical protein CVM73_07430 [Bradyrhizobium forestalis]